METLVVNFFAGPGAGKSTTAAALFALLKMANVNCELVTEFAKDRCWEGLIPKNQVYIFGEQHQRIHRLLGKVSVIVTDSPFVLSLHYGGNHSPEFTALVLAEHNRLNTLNVFLERKKKFQQAGRDQNEAQARDIDTAVRDLLVKHHIPFITVDGDNGAAQKVASLLSLA